jgi:ubiquinone/menaquinone biosynthesis C-methylase UbiE
VDAVAFRDGQRDQWNTAATGWDKWSSLIDEGANVVSDRLVDLAAVQEGSRVLDIACGYGEPSLPAARKAGPDGSVVATDIAKVMLEFAAKRAADAGVANIEFVESEAIALDFPDDSFDAALSRWGVIFEPEAEQALNRIRGFLKPGAKIAVSSWGTPEEVPFLSVPMRTTMKELNVPPPPPGMPGPLSRPTPEALTEVLEAGGFSDVEVEKLEATFDYESAAEFTQMVREIAPPITAMMADHPPEAQEAAWQAIEDAIGEYAGDDGRLSLSNIVLLGSGKA